MALPETAPIQPDSADNLDGRYHELTPDQEADVDRYADQGMNYLQALMAAGVEVDYLGSHSEPSAQPSLPTLAERRTNDRPMGRKSDGSIDRRSLSARQRLTADKIPYYPS